jgi:hypothetical protein
MDFDTEKLSDDQRNKIKRFFRTKDGTYRNRGMIGMSRGVQPPETQVLELKEILR